MCFKKQKTTTFFWLALVFLAPFLPYLNLTPNFDVSVLRILILLLGLGLSVWFLKQKPLGRQFCPSLAIFILLFLLWSVGSSFWAENLSWALRKGFFLVNFFGPTILGLFFLKRRETKDRQSFLRKTGQVLILAAVFLGAIGLCQFAAQFFIAPEAIFDFWIGRLTPVFSGATLSSLVSDFPSWFFNWRGQSWLRAVSLLPDPHMLAFVMGTTSFLSLGFFVGTKQKKYLLAFGFLTVVLFLTFSRGGYLAFLAGLLFFLFFYWRQAGWRFKKIFFITALLLLFFSFFGSGVFWARLTSSFDLDDGSNQGRLIIWQEAISLAKQAPIFGFGLSDYAYLVNPTADYRSPVTAHNLYLELLVELGLVGALLFLAILANAFWGGLKKVAREPLRGGVLAALVYFLVHSFFEIALFNPLVVFVLCLLLVFSTIKTSAIIKKN